MLTGEHHEGGAPATGDIGFRQAALIRHAGVCVAALIAYLLRGELGVSSAVLWVLGLAAVLNLLTYLGSRHGRLASILRVLSPFFGIAGWTALVYLTQGVRSPFIAGFGLEIVLSAMSLAVKWPMLVTLGAIAAVWAQQALLGLRVAEISLLALQTSFLLAMGAVTLLVTRLWIRAQRALSLRNAQFRERLRALEQELEEVRTVGKVGENVAWVAHGIKNAVHNLRGLVQLIEPDTRRSAGSGALEALAASIDGLEDLARWTLGGKRPLPERSACCGTAEVHRALDAAVVEISNSFPEIRVSRRFEPLAGAIPASAGVLREVSVVLLRNAAESMHGKGEIVLRTAAVPDGFELQVRDHGCGLPGGDAAEIFKPGHTTKTGGSGFGLFLIRRLLNGLGGEITAVPAEGGGTLVSVKLPVELEGELHVKPFNSHRG